MTGPALTPPVLTGWTVTRHGKALFLYAPTGEYAGATGRVRTGPDTGRWWTHTTGAGNSITTYPNRDAALAAIRAAYQHTREVTCDD